ncbi:hypothetical protein TNCV_3237021 [Trichonephila clavipes]|nr:hypothetical protein TNCV_3237021 [Trichonephila clavipes]
MCCPSFRSTAVRSVTTAFSSNSCIMADTFRRMESFSAAIDAVWSQCTFDFKNPHSHRMSDREILEAMRD